MPLGLGVRSCAMSGEHRSVSHVTFRPAPRSARLRGRLRVQPPLSRCPQSRRMCCASDGGWCGSWWPVRGRMRRRRPLDCSSSIWVRMCHRCRWLAGGSHPAWRQHDPTRRLAPRPSRAPGRGAAQPLATAQQGVSPSLTKYRPQRMHARVAPPRPLMPTWPSPPRPP